MYCHYTYYSIHSHELGVGICVYLPILNYLYIETTHSDLLRNHVIWDAKNEVNKYLDTAG
jgi:hypothetical protein